MQGTPDKPRVRSRPSSLIVMPPTDSPAHPQHSKDRDKDRADNDNRMPPPPPPVANKPKSETLNVHV